MGWILRLQNFSTMLYSCYRLDEENVYMPKNDLRAILMSYAMLAEAASLN